MMSWLGLIKNLRKIPKEFLEDGSK
jgi:hypothetical protein